MSDYTTPDYPEKIGKMRSTDDVIDYQNKRIAVLEAALRDIWERMGGPECEGWDSQEDVNGICRAALEQKGEGS